MSEPSPSGENFNKNTEGYKILFCFLKFAAKYLKQKLDVLKLQNSTLDLTQLFFLSVCNKCFILLVVIHITSKIKKITNE